MEIWSGVRARRVDEAKASFANLAVNTARVVDKNVLRNNLLVSNMSFLDRTSGFRTFTLEQPFLSVELANSENCICNHVRDGKFYCRTRSF